MFYLIWSLGGSLRIFEWGWAAGTLETLVYTGAISAEFCNPILDLTPQISIKLVGIGSQKLHTQYR